jgi:hypothetical protein
VTQLQDQIRVHRPNRSSLVLGVLLFGATLPSAMLPLHFADEGSSFPEWAKSAIFFAWFGLSIPAVPFAGQGLLSVIVGVIFWSSVGGAISWWISQRKRGVGYGRLLPQMERSTAEGEKTDESESDADDSESRKSG